MTCSQSGCEVQRHVSAFSLKTRCACHFILNGAVPNSTLALHCALKPQEPRSSGPWTPGAPAPAPAEVLASRGTSWSRGKWSRGKWQAAGVISVVGKVALTLYPPLRPLSHNNVNHRDGAEGVNTITASPKRSGVWSAKSQGLQAFRPATSREINPWHSKYLRSDGHAR
jgi:hypothetical protein